MTRRRFLTDRGATVVEYALVMAVLGCVVVAGVKSLEGKSGTELTAQGHRIGMPEDGGAVQVTTSTTSGPIVTTTTAAPTSAARIAGALGEATVVNGHKWVAKATFTVRAADNTVIANATVTGTWTIDGGSSATTSCVTNGAGVCNVTRDKLDDDDDVALFTLTDIAGSGLSWTAGSDTPSSVVINQPPGV
ncbi:MAG: hypothetical protein QOH68_3130 [Nocardioidaceae bacterium]|jgi:Flp pilus assembly pilin Flp|nr:hypothetical protein [Nocardioidaceae bacterium]